jgi:hypothetical protein
VASDIDESAKSLVDVLDASVKRYGRHTPPLQQLTGWNDKTTSSIRE